MINIIDNEQCCGCGACSYICPHSCITMQSDFEGFLYPSVDSKRCVECDLCSKVCPFRQNGDFHDPIITYAGKNPNREMRKNSSSGGIFSAIAEFVLDSGGVVYGVSMNGDCSRCEFTRVTDKEHLLLLQGSKYIQSYPPDYYRVKADLDSGCTVLFSGTPCQVNGLKKYLRNDYFNLICVDILCHGVPSDKLWIKYKNYIEKKEKGRVTNVVFRSKKIDWLHFGLHAKTDTNRELFSPAELDPYMNMFLNNYSLRPSCYNCKAKILRYADITLGDFWGIRDVNPDFYDPMGVSLIIVRTNRGNDIISEIENAVQLQCVNYLKSIRNNPAEYESVEKPRERDEFYEDIGNYTFEASTKKYAMIPFQRILKSDIYRIVNKLIGGVKRTGYGIKISLTN